MISCTHGDNDQFVAQETITERANGGTDPSQIERLRT